MKNAKQITLSGVTFSIEVDAYEKLNGYLSEVESYFSKSMGDASDEVLEDIEASIAEKMLERGRGVQKAIILKDIESVMAELGSVSEMSDGEVEEGDTETVETRAKAGRSRKLYRDADDVVIAGVASGLAKYFDIDVAIVRILFIVSLFVGGTGFWLYIILWVAVSKAETPSQKMASRGESVNLESVKSYVKSRIDEVPEGTWGAVKDFLRKVVGIVAVVLPLVKRVAGVFIMIVSGLIILLLTVLLIAALHVDTGILVEMDAMTQDFMVGMFSSTSTFLQMASFYFVVIIPTWLVFMFGKWLVWSKTRIHQVLFVIVTISWMFAFSYALVITIVQASKVGTYIEAVELSTESGTDDRFFIHIKERSNGAEVFKIDINGEGIIIEADKERLYTGGISGIPFGTDPMLVGGDAEPGSPLDDVTLVGIGTEPFWSFKYSSGKVVWSMPEADAVGNIKEVIYDVGFARNGTDYNLWGLGDSDIAITITEGTCSDGMSDNVHTHTVLAALSDYEYRGCANLSQN